MSIRQYYKSRARLNNQAFPVQPNGASLNWNKNHMIPFFAGNFWQVNYIEGLQTPSFDVNFVLLDGNVATCPLHPASGYLLDRFITRSDDFSHDVTAFSSADGTGLSGTNYVCDAYLKLGFPGVKGNSFMISGSKGDDVRMSANCMIYSANPANSIQKTIESYSSADYPTFEGNPIRFQALKFLLNGSCIDNIVSFQLTYSNNLVADLSMACGTTLYDDGTSATDPIGSTFQNPLPIDVNASQPSCALSLMMQTQHADNIQTGDYLEIQIVQGSISTSLLCSRLVIDTQNSVSIGAGRQMRPLNCTVVGIDNNTPPLIIS